MDASKNAVNNQVVFAMNADYYTYRIGGERRVGVVVRDGKKIYDDHYKTAASREKLFPNMDTLSIYPDGHLEVWHSEEKTAKDFIDAGAETVLAFGPYLIKDGQLSDYVFRQSSTENLNPRCAFGMVEPGHYVAIMAEGRLTRSQGITLNHLALLMRAKGCECAMNLDGGQTAVMVFMGKQLNQIGKYNGQTNARPTTEILGVGTSDMVGKVDFQ